MVQESYVRNALFLSLNLLGDFESSIAHEVLQRDMDAWRRTIIDCVANMHRLPIPHHITYQSRQDIEIQVVSLLFDLLNTSGGRSNPNERFREERMNLTPLDILILYGLSFGVRTPTPHRFGAFNPSQLQRALSRSRIFVKVTNDNHIQLATILKVDDWRSNLIKALSIAFPTTV